MSYNTIIFGPVPSRRLGRSLGLSIVPSKVCSLDCVYCEVGATTKLTTEIAPYIHAEEVLKAFDEHYPAFAEVLDVVTVTGAGEPTLNSELGAILKGLKKRTTIPIAILTNSTTITNPAVMESLLAFDIVVPSLDAVSPEVFIAVDKPDESLDIVAITAALQEFSQKYTGQLFLELLLVKGLNDSPMALVAFAKAAEFMKYTKIQVSTVYRPPAWGAEALSEKEIAYACEFLAAMGLRVAPVGEFKGSTGSSMAAKPQLLSIMLKMRPLTIKEITQALSITMAEAFALVNEIENVQGRIHAGECYYGFYERDR